MVYGILTQSTFIYFLFLTGKDTNLNNCSGIVSSPSNYGGRAVKFTLYDTCASHPRFIFL